MLFSSFEFILFFLPTIVVVYYYLQKKSQLVANLALVGASLFFYAWWDPKYLLLLLMSMMINFYIGSKLIDGSVTAFKRWLLSGGLILNLGFLAYFKYAFFIVSNVDLATGTQWAGGFSDIVLPLAISFFTFQQIAYLVDSYKGLRKPENFINYTLFIVFFPQLIAGPIVHHHEMMTQFAQHKPLDWDNVTRGLMIFVMGLAKKVVLADSIAPYANSVFHAASTQTTMTFFDAWSGALAYSFQLYFDFSGYADMAIGVALMFGIRLPLNFYSPYKAVNIIEFWRRWHMTLGRFLKDYVYIPLGGNRSGPIARHRNLFVTMLLGGIWHGAGWNFLIWGALHGSFLMTNHIWLGLKTRYHFPKINAHLATFLSITVTFLLVVVAWVFFRATSFDSAMVVLRGMFGFNGIALPPQLVSFTQIFSWGGWLHVSDGWLEVFESRKALLFLLGLAAVSFFMPNTAQIFRVSEGEPSFLVWRKTLHVAAIMSLMAVVALFFVNGNNEFLYFQF